MSYTKPNAENKEMEVLLQDNLSTLRKCDSSNDVPFDSQAVEIKNVSNETKECKHFLEKETVDVTNLVNNYEIRIWRKKKVKINKSLFAFRVTQFLWYGAASIPSQFLGIFLKQRGLTLVELSSVYSMIFLFQLITGLITGVITDKIGNAKPVLIFLMVSTCSVLVSFSLSPNITNTTCAQLRKNLNNTDTLEDSQNFSSCYINCLEKNRKYLQIEENYTERSVLENAFAIERFGLDINDDNNSICDFFNTALSNDSFDLSKDKCCDACANTGQSDCIKVRKGYLVAVYSILIIAFYSVYSTAFRFMNFVAIALAVKTDSHFGKEYAVGRCGNLAALIVVAFVLNIDKSSGSEINFDPIFWLAAGTQLCAFLTLFLNRVPILPPGKNVIRKGLNLMKDVDILVFILIVFVAGNGHAFKYALHLVFLKEINAPKMVITLNPIAVYLYAFPALLTSEWWVKKLGVYKLFVLGLLSFAANYVAYSFIENPWWSFLIDTTAFFSNNLFWVAVVVHCHSIAPVGFAATLNALAGTVHFGIGRSSGVFFGGMLMNYMGPRQAYRIMGAVLITTALLYSLFIFMRRKSPTVKVAVIDIANNKTADNTCTKSENNQDAGFIKGLKICE